MTLNDNITTSGKSTANLMIRLLIPPQKERVLVMEGMVEKIAMSSSLPMARSTFGIPLLEEKAKRASNDISELEDIIYCGGTVWIEDATVSRQLPSIRQQDEIGQFSLVKILTPGDTSQFTITIPKSVRNQD
jgi:hypothetical protein